MFSFIVKQKGDGQIRVSGINIDQQTFDEAPFTKDQIKTMMERELKGRGIKVLGDRGVVEDVQW